MLIMEEKELTVFFENKTIWNKTVKLFLQGNIDVLR